jgi:hypothetical protein
MDEKEFVIERFKEYLLWARSHYDSLYELMTIHGKEKYANEHNGKTKFIDLLLLKIKNGDFRNEVKDCSCYSCETEKQETPE